MKRVVCADGRRLEYILIQTSRKNLLMQALPDGQTRVYAPAWMGLRDIDAEVRRRICELQAMHAQLEHALEQNRLEHPVSSGSRICVEGRGLSLDIRQGAQVSLRIEGDSCVLCLKDAQDEGAVRQAIRQGLSRLALERIREKLELYAPKLGVNYGRVAIRDQRSRWGSCSAKHNLNFNWKLIMAPPQVLEYVVIHELCHLIEFNHSARFWRLVEGQMPEYEAWKKWLKVHGGELGV